MVKRREKSRGMKTSVVVIMTCFNRREKSRECLRSLLDERLFISFIVVDDASSDGTAEALREVSGQEGVFLHLIEGSGKLYWAGGMRKGMTSLMRSAFRPDYVALVNDDVKFEKNALMRMIERSEKFGGSAVSAATADSSGRISYGGVLYRKGSAHTGNVSLEEADRLPLDAANCNCLLLPCDVFCSAGVFDRHYVHSMADYDYSFSIRRGGCKIYLTDFIAGRCEDNPVENTWRDTSLGRLRRLELKESEKGLPWREWFYYLKKNFGLRLAVWHSITPYLRILLGI